MGDRDKGVTHSMNQLLQRAGRAQRRAAYLPLRQGKGLSRQHQRARLGDSDPSRELAEGPPSKTRCWGRRALKGRKTSSGHMFGLVPFLQGTRWKGWLPGKPRGVGQWRRPVLQAVSLHIFSGGAWPLGMERLVVGTFRPCWVHLDWNHHSTQ